MELNFPNLEVETPKNIRAKNHFDIQFGKYRVYVADHRVDFYKALQLRSRVFYKDSNHFDIDEYDFLADHILIENTSNREVIGTYRMISNVFSDRFYTQSEFDLKDFLSLEGVKIELGRACIEESYRNGRSIDLLWRGVATYMTLINAKYLFGCSSLFLKEDNVLESISHLKTLRSRNIYNILPHQPYAIEGKKVEKPNIPGLLRAYMRSGATILGDPAWDKEMNCVDFFTLLDVENLSEGFKKHYFSKSFL